MTVEGRAEAEGELHPPSRPRTPPPLPTSQNAATRYTDHRYQLRPFARRIEVFGANYCLRCGKSLECTMCGGTGLGWLPPSMSQRCCGRSQLGSYCTICGLRLVNLVDRPRCSRCGGTGRVPHVCLRL